MLFPSSDADPTSPRSPGSKPCNLPAISHTSLSIQFYIAKKIVVLNKNKQSYRYMSKEKSQEKKEKNDDVHMN